jgi:lysophospholipase L1-like esterase
MTTTIKTGIGRILALMFLLALPPAARWLEWTISTSFGTGDGEIARFGISHAVAALPALVAVLIFSLCLWWFRNFSKNLVLSVCVALVCGGLLNFAAEVIIESRPGGIGDQKAYRALYPYIGFKGSPQIEDNNALGYGGKVPERQKAAHEYRIVFIGGSTVRFGKPAIPELVEQLFRADGSEDVKVFNFGVSGSNSAMELARLVHEVMDYRPDLVVSYSGGNDINLPLIDDPRPGYPFNFMIQENHPLWSEHYPWLLVTAYGSHLARLAAGSYFIEQFSQQRELRQTSGWKTEEWRRQVAATYVHNLEKSARIAATFDSGFVAFLQPSLLTKKNPSGAERALLDTFTKGTEAVRGVSSDEWHLHDEFVRKQIIERAAGRAPEFPFVDMSAEFDGIQESTYADLIHTRQTAQPILAKRIYDRLREFRAATPVHPDRPVHTDSVSDAVARAAGS